jgi:nucleotidyltransferase/DNA polymerase involved in DNA repair
MKDLPITKLQGVGKVHNNILSGLGIHSCKELLAKAVEVYVTYTENQFRFFIR